MNQPLPVGPLAASSTTRLYWSVKGEVACELHIPDRDSAEWWADRWMLISDMGARTRDWCQCQHCAARSPLRHRVLSPFNIV